MNTPNTISSVLEGSALKPTSTRLSFYTYWKIQRSSCLPWNIVLSLHKHNAREKEETPMRSNRENQDDKNPVNY